MFGPSPSHEFGDVPQASVGGQMGDASMQMQAELRREDLVGEVEPVVVASLFEQGEIDLLIVAAEDSPRHLNGTVTGNPHVDQRCRFREGQAKSPSTEHVPVLDARQALELDQLFLALFGYPDVLKRHVWPRCRNSWF